MKTNLWSSAAVNGFILALITIVFTLVQTAFPMKGMAAGLLIMIVKLTATVGTLYYFMKAMGQEEESYPYSDAFKYGFAVSICSNIVISCYLWTHYTMIFPDAINDMLEVMGPALAQKNADSSTLDTIFNNFPVILSITLIVLYSIYGVIFSAVLASFVKKPENIFADKTSNES